MLRFDVVIVLLFWTFALSIAMLQNSSILTEVRDLWLQRLERAKADERRIADIEASAASMLSRGGSAARDAQWQARGGEIVNVTRMRELFARLHRGESIARDSIASLEAARQRRKKSRRAGSSDGGKKKAPADDNGGSRGGAAPPLMPMRTGCGTYSAQDSLKRLVSTVQSRLYEPDSKGVLSAFASGRGGTHLDTIRIDASLSSLGADIEAVLEHLEATMPRVAERWARWFESDGRPVPAPLFADDAESHISERDGRRAYELTMRNN